jgi:hypothetical protein
MSLVVFAQQLQEILAYLLLVFKKRHPVKAADENARPVQSQEQSQAGN